VTKNWLDKHGDYVGVVLAWREKQMADADESVL
jgi:hypothetical protein